MDIVKVEDRNQDRDQEVEEDQIGVRKLDNNPIAITNHVGDVISTIGTPSNLSIAGPSRRTVLKNDLPLQQMFVHDVELPISESPMFGQICVKDSTDIQFGDKNIYTDGVTVEQIFYPKINSSDDNDRENKEKKEETSNSRSARVSPKVKKWLIGSFLLIAAVVCVVVVVLTRGDPPGPNEPRIITRAEWKARAPHGNATNLELPVPFVVISHTATDFCFTRSDCELSVFNLQTFDFEVCQYDDIAFNFLVGGDGNVYEGRGWDHVGAHTWTYNQRGIGISLIGNFSTVGPTDRQLLATQQLIKLGVYEGKLARDYKLIGHRQNSVSKTDSPGDFAYDIIITWPHWEFSLVPIPDKYEPRCPQNGTVQPLYKTTQNIATSPVSPSSTSPTPTRSPKGETETETE